MLLIHALMWWSVWDYREVEWNFARFLTVNSVPLIAFFISAILVPRNTDAGISDLRTHFFRIRPLLMAAYGTCLVIWIVDGPLVFDTEAWFNTLRIGQAGGLVLVLGGLLGDDERIHIGIALCCFLLTLTGTVGRFMPGAFGTG